MEHRNAQARNAFEFGLSERAIDARLPTHFRRAPTHVKRRAAPSATETAEGLRGPWAAKLEMRACPTTTGPAQIVAPPFISARASFPRGAPVKASTQHTAQQHTAHAFPLPTQRNMHPEVSRCQLGRNVAKCHPPEAGMLAYSRPAFCVT